MEERLHSKGETDSRLYGTDFRKYDTDSRQYDMDFRKYDRVWDRVLPLLNPWGTGDNPPSEKLPIDNSISPPDTESQSDAESQSSTTFQSDTDQLSGAAWNPCCMDNAIKAESEILADFIERELSERRQFLALARRSPAWGRQTIRELSAAAWGRAKRLLALYYLITGETYAPAVCVDRTHTGRWLPALRERYHAAACCASRYARAAEETAAPCLQEAFAEMSAAAYQNAAALLRLLERSMAS